MPYIPSCAYAAPSSWIWPAGHALDLDTVTSTRRWQQYIGDPAMQLGHAIVSHWPIGATNPQCDNEPYISLHLLGADSSTLPPRTERPMRPRSTCPSSPNPMGPAPSRGRSRAWIGSPGPKRDQAPSIEDRRESRSSDGRMGGLFASDRELPVDLMSTGGGRLAWNSSRGVDYAG